MLTTIIIRRRIQSAMLALAIVFVMHDCTHAQKEDPIAAQLCEILYQARFAQGEIKLEAKLAANAKNEAIRASLGIVQFVKAVEELSQDYYRFGMEPQRGIAIGNMLMQRTGNPKPEPIGYEDARGILERFEQRLIKAEKTLSEFRYSGIKFPIDVSRIYLDINNDGKKTGNVLLASIIAVGATGSPNSATLVGNSATFAFDDADVLWLRGYIHVMLGTVNIALAHDWRDAFERTAHLIFAKPKTAYPYLLEIAGQRTHSILAWI